MSKRILYNISSSNLVTTNVSAGTVNLSTGLTSNKIIINNTLTTTGNYIYGTNGNSFTTNVLSNINKFRVSRAVANSCVSSTSWTRYSNVSSANRGICWSPELSLFVIVGVQNFVLTSYDGLTWTSRSVSQNNTWNCIAWSSELGIFAASASTGTNRIMTSSDGISWTMRNATTNTYNGICWCPELLIFVTVGSTVSRSSDGINWSDGTIPAGTWNSVCWSPELGLFVAVNSTGGIATSTNGSTFTSQTSPTSNILKNVCWSPELNLFVAVSETSSSTGVVTSNDGITWTLRSTPTYALQAVAWSPYLSIFVAVGFVGAVISSSDGITWTDIGPVGGGSNRTICWSPELSSFVFAHSTSANSIYRSNPPSICTGDLNVYSNIIDSGPPIYLATTGGNIAGYMTTSNNSDSSNKVVIASNRTSGAILFDTRSGGTIGSRMIINNDGNVGVGTTSPASLFHLVESSANNANPANIFIDRSNERAAIQVWNYGNTRSNLFIGSNMYVDNSGNGVLNTTAGNAIGWYLSMGNQNDRFNITRTTATNTGVDYFRMVSSGSTLFSILPGENQANYIRIGRFDSPTIRYHDLEFQTSATAASSYMSIQLHDAVTTTSQKDVMRLRGDGNVGIGTTAPQSTLHVAGSMNSNPLGSGVHMGIDSGGNATMELNSGTVGSGTNYIDFGYGGIDYVSRIIHNTANRNLTFQVNTGTTAMTLNSSGSVSIPGALSKGSGTFDIDHPILETKRLVHSFIEGPRCDLIYRGKVTLTNGMATVNIDTDCVHELDCAMTDGTFTSLCANPQFFLQNPNSFNLLCGSISGNILTITCEDNTSTEEVYWQVIAERKDPLIKNWVRTNPNGYLVTEFYKE